MRAQLCTVLSNHLEQGGFPAGHVTSQIPTCQSDKQPSQNMSAASDLASYNEISATYFALQFTNNKIIWGCCWSSLWSTILIHVFQCTVYRTQNYDQYGRICEVQFYLLRLARSFGFIFATTLLHDFNYKSKDLSLKTISLGFHCNQIAPSFCFAPLHHHDFSIKCKIAL